MSVDIAADVPAEDPIVVIPPLTGGKYRYAMALLMSVSVVNYIDRQVINIIAEPIKRELYLADWQLGALTGLAFGLLRRHLPVACPSHGLQNGVTVRGSSPWPRPSGARSPYYSPA